MKCQACKEQEASWAWQPWGPSETPDSFMMLGSHYRGFPIVKVCASCKSAFQTGDFPVAFTYKGHKYIAEDHQIREKDISLWIGEQWMTSDLNPFEATAIMRDTPDEGPELVALVESADLVQSFVIAPNLVEDCEKLLKYRHMIEQCLEAGWMQQSDRTAIGLALAAIQVTLNRREEKNNG